MARQTRIKDLHMIWMQDPDYLKEYDALEEEAAITAQVMKRPLFEEPIGIEREDAWSGPKGFLIGGMTTRTASEMAREYMDAANVIVDAIKREEIEDFRLANPALFLYRHGLELMLKSILPNAAKNHRLDKLAAEFEAFVRAEFGEDVPVWFTQRLNEIGSIDPGSTTFRYGREAQSAPLREGELHVNLDHLQSVMASLVDALNRVLAAVASKKQITS